MTAALARNDVRQYAALAEHWWRPNGAFAMLHWLAQARARLIPPASRDGAVLLDLACGGGVLAPYAAKLGYRHVGLDLEPVSLALAREHGVTTVLADVRAVPFADSSADVVAAGEILEHVAEPSTVVAEACRVLRPGGLLVLDTINATAIGRFVAVTLAERVGGTVTKGIHDPSLFVSPALVVGQSAKHGVKLTVRGIRPAVMPLLRWVVTRRGWVPIVPTRSVAVLYQGWGVKEG